MGDEQRNDPVAEAKETIAEVYDAAAVTRSGRHLTTINQLTDQLPALEPDTLDAAATLIGDAGAFDVDKIAVEEDKGLPIGVVVAREHRLPLAVARWYTYELDAGIEQQSEVDIDSEYYTGRLYLNGVAEGDSVAVVDDTISTGGTMIAMIEAIEAAGATVESAHCIVEKAGKGGVERVAAETGVDVTTALTIEVGETDVSVTDY